MSLTVVPERNSAPPVETCTMPSDSASAKPRSAAFSVCEDVTLMPGEAKALSFARVSISAYTSGVAMGILDLLLHGAGGGNACEYARFDAATVEAEVPLELSGRSARRARRCPPRPRPRPCARRSTRLPHRGKRRRVGHVEVDHVLQGHLVPQCGGNGVDPLGRTLLADDLPDAQPPGALLCAQLGGDRRRPGE